jgi:hypothetical protein
MPRRLAAAVKSERFSGSIVAYIFPQREPCRQEAFAERQNGGPDRARIAPTSQRRLPAPRMGFSPGSCAAADRARVHCGWPTVNRFRGDSIAPSGPTAAAATRAGGEIAVEFCDVERELVAYRHDSPIGFELCADSQASCRFAQSRIDGTRVLLPIPNGCRRPGFAIAGPTVPHALCSTSPACRRARSS